MDNKLLIRYILGKANQKESEQIAEWIKESPENPNSLFRNDLQQMRENCSLREKAILKSGITTTGR